jgi:subtilisin family serine protease/putative cell wall-binding protein
VPFPSHPSNLSQGLGRLVAALLALACAAAVLVGGGPAHAQERADRTADMLVDADAKAALQQRMLAELAGEPEPEVVPGSLLVTHRAARVPALLDRLPAPARRALRDRVPEQIAEGVLHVRVDPAEVDDLRAALEAQPDVVAVEPERVWSFTERRPNDARYAEQWAHEQAQAPAAWAIATGSSNRRIAIIDSGIDGRHPELASRIVSRHVVRPLTGGGFAFEAGAVDNDGCGAGHGTLVAGVAAASGNNGDGVAGVAWNAGLIDIAIATSGSCSPTDAKVIRALGEIAQGRVGVVDVVNLSLGGREPRGVCPAALQGAINTVVQRGTTVVAAAGNEGDLALSVPAMCRGVIAVGATGRTGERASYSSVARYIDVAAPGGDGGGSACDARACILTTARGGGYRAPEGTSFAAPYVAGAVALLLDVDRTLTPAQIESVLELTASGAGRHDHRLGWGRVRLGAALAHVRDGRPIPAPRVHPAVRVAWGGGTTDAVRQAVAVSQATFDRGIAPYAVLARDDDFADALAGSSLAYGIAPLLFGPRAGDLPPATAAELRRAVRSGGVVYLLGGTAALDARLDNQIRSIGLTPIRLFGPSREHTAVAVSQELRRVLERFGQAPSRAVLLATRSNWPDAVAAGSLGAAFGVPILLTPRADLHSATRDHLSALARSGPGLSSIYVVGGPGVIADLAEQRARSVTGARSYRLSGPARDATAVRVAEEFRFQLGQSSRPAYSIAVELDRPDGFAHALSASVLAGSTFSVFVPVRAPSAGNRLTNTTVASFCRLGNDALLAGDTDLLPDAIGAELLDVLSGSSPRC